ncbi:carboxypeptidase regulatory-like domain-containing protein [Burkholderia ubonensis]|uniref:carboxypeptidase regulatory-like domain-containing protein n=1 Tax=Burkholderia ubonensis TaxID=101571 RepID=UPI000F564BFF|nr:carboxypeptidase regulatory-like domain-containing protein [Burkholderia ubonensis]RQP27053.1 carboxypeptidase regulatory-like domain-containing protein [Burkholderia ubonensis]RQP28638.1 carboxypeptidase regulatory-like domain-containing protein [Burkholderia ubonensis]RQP29537.1 carboxypeptidase regulatory-like domain-containing protein [Burkholderia ubonensis]RQP46000.1 carboxypeptidase regulatory-like domain-containing protein [Burkholderia ubonensis]RQP48810.1 carboxypeptidase regulato
MFNRIARLLFTSICLLGIGTDALAEPSPVPIERGGIVYVTGGIGADDANSFHEVAPRYNLRITLASRTGEYLSDVDITITSGTTPILDVQTAGPFLFARVPPGRYTVLARGGNALEVRHVVVPARGGVDVRFYWADPDRRDVARLCPGCPLSREPETP